MTELIDAEIVKEFNRILNFPLNRMVYGQLITARNYWTRFLSSNKGVAMLPYMAFYRTHTFHDGNRKTDMVDIIDVDDVPKRVMSMQVMLNYTIEFMTQTVSEQNKIMKRYLFWAAQECAIGIKDADGVEWKFRIIPDNPEDNSDLDDEDATGRVIRTTLNFSVESILFDRTDEQTGIILDILANIHGYYGDSLYTQIEISE